MEIELKPYGSFPCEAEIFKVNGIKADLDDFGSSINYPAENEEDEAEEGGCDNRVFERKKPTTAVLFKYDINEVDYEAICDKLEAEMTVGCCGWCN